MKSSKDKIEKYTKTTYEQNVLIKRHWHIAIRGLIILLLTNGAVWMPMHHTAHAARDSAPAPAGYWKFDEGSGATANDSSGNNNPGAITGATWTTGEVNGALSFTGTTNYVSMGTPPTLKFGLGSFTVISWFKTTATAFQRMVDMGMNNWSNGFELSFDETGSCPNSTTGCVTAALGGGSAGTSFSFGTTAHTFADGNWHQTALVVDQTAKTAQIYVDGMVQAVTERTGTCTSGTAVTSISISGCGSLNATNSTDPFTVGDLLSGGVSTNPFTGSLDEVRAYNSALSSGQIANQYGIDSGATPTGYWKFDEGSGPTANDSSGNNNPGAITGAGWTTGQVNGALSFTGTTNYVSMGTPPALKFGLGSFTVISWFKTTATVFGRMVSMGMNAFGTGFDLGVNVTNTCSAGCVGAELGGGTQGTSVSFGSTATTFNTGIWHQAAMVIDQTANTGQLYVDGVVQSLAKQTNTCGTVSGTGISIDISACGSASATATSDPFTVGAYHGSSTLYSFTGSLDEVRVYNTALSSAQITNQYSIDTGATPNGYWKFDEGSGTTANDSSGNNNPGAITGAGWTTGQVNGALSFNGTTNYVSMGTSPAALQFGAGSFTVINWFKTADTGGYNRMVSMGDYGWTTGYFIGIGFYPAGCAGCVGVGLGGGTQAASLATYTTSSFNDNIWHQEATVINQVTNTAQIYVDGVAQTVTTQPSTCGTASGTSVNFAACGSLSATNAGTFNVGSYTGTQDFFHGSLDEVRVYGSPLNSAQILNQYTLDTTTINPLAISVYGQGTGNVFNTNATGTTSSTFNGVKRVVLDSSGGLYATDYGNNRVLYFPSGSKTATRVYGQNATGTNFTVGTANTGGISATTLNGPKGIALDSAGNLYVADSNNNRVLFYPISGGIAAVTPTRVYGQGTAGNVFNAAAVSTSTSGISAPAGITLDSQNNLYVADASNNRVLYFPSAAGVAGTAAFTATRVYGQGISFTTGTANQCSCTTDSALTLSNPVDVLVDSSGDLYVADTANNRVIYYPTWTANNMAATHVYGQTNFTGFAANQGGVITATTLYSPYGLALDSNGDLYVSDQLNNRILYYPTWTANPMAATRVYGQSGSFTTGTANYCSCTTDNNSSLSSPWGIYLDPTGHLYVADFTNNRILEFWTHLTITTQPPASTAATSTFSLATSLIDDGSQLVFSHFTGAVSVAITTGTAGATLSGTTSVNAVSGVATFSNLSIDTGGAGYILTTSYPGVGSATTNAFTIVGSLFFTPLTPPSFAFTLTGATGTITSLHTFKVKDTRGSAVGWHVTITSTQFISGSKTLPTTAMTITGVSTACTAGQTCVVPVNGINTYPITVPAATTAPAAISYFSANGNTGTGNVTLTVTFSLSIPPGTASGTYTSTVTETVVNVS